MKTTKPLLDVAKKISSGSVIMLLVAGLSILIGCNKESPSTSKELRECQSRFDQDHGNPQPEGLGTNNGYFWSLYREGGAASIAFGSGGNFAVSYSNVTNVVGGKGWNPGSARTIGYNVIALCGNYDFVGIYGWTTNPLIEYYVAEMGSMARGTFVNSINSDGRQYSFYKSQRVNAPSIIGTATFWQYKDTWGGAPTGRALSVNMANHIKNWRSNGGHGFGNYNYQILAIEAWGGKSGYMNATVR